MPCKNSFEVSWNMITVLQMSNHNHVSLSAVQVLVLGHMEWKHRGHNWAIELNSLAICSFATCTIQPEEDSASIHMQEGVAIYLNT